MLKDKSISIDKLSERLNNLYLDQDDKDNEGITHWKGKRIIPSEDWKRIAVTGVKGSLFKEPFLGFAPIGLQFFPDDLVEFALGFEGHSVNPYDESIFPYHDDDPRPGTLEWKMSLDIPDSSKRSDAELKLWRTRLQERRAKAKKEDPFEIWISEYKELLAFKKIPLPVHDDSYII